MEDRKKQTAQEWLIENKEYSCWPKAPWHNKRRIPADSTIPMWVKRGKDNKVCMFCARSEEYSYEDTGDNYTDTQEEGVRYIGRSGNYDLISESDLTELQKQRLAMRDDGLTDSEIAEQEGTSRQNINDFFKRIENRLQKRGDDA